LYFRIKYLNINNLKEKIKWKKSIICIQLKY
jgi:hypothetical protein